MSVPTALVAGPAIRILLGPAYAPAAGVLAIHVFSNVFIFLGVAQSLWLVNEAAGRISLYRAVVGAVVCVLGNLILIPRFGVHGAAMVAVLSQAFAAVVSNALFAPAMLRLQIYALLQRRA